MAGPSDEDSDEEDLLLLSRPPPNQPRKEIGGSSRASPDDILDSAPLNAADLAIPSKKFTLSRKADIQGRGEGASLQSRGDADADDDDDDDEDDHLFLTTGQLQQASAQEMAKAREEAMAFEREHAVELPCDGIRPAFPAPTNAQRALPLHLSKQIQVPASINRFLREYQREGVRFFHNAWARGRGGILGDDMGLGKTIQVIAFMAAIMRKTGFEEKDDLRRISAVREGKIGAGKQKANAIWPTCLIVCPASVISNWQNELDTWGYFEHAVLDDQSIGDFERGRLDILITSHETARLRIERLEQQDWSVVFVDECHKLKNRKSGVTEALSKIKCQSKFGLTGTAIQNRFEELWTLLDWSNPGCFGTGAQWASKVVEPIRRGQSSSAGAAELAQARMTAEELVTRTLPGYFLRRTKALIRDQLPIKRDNIVFCPLTTIQVQVYKMILAEPEVNMLRRAYDPCDCGARDEDGLPYRRCLCCHSQTDDGAKWNTELLRFISLLQKCSNHVALTFPDPNDNIAEPAPPASLTPADEERRKRFLRQTSMVQSLFPNDWQTRTANKRNGFQQEYCGKWLILRDLMRAWKKDGDKMLLFSMNLRLLDWIGSFIEMEGFSYVRLDGSTPQKKRQALVDSFNQNADIFCFLISTTAGGTGLNLTGANRVVVFDPHWNPAHDLQAMDRAYRFGQTRNVDVYRLIGRGSLEEVIYDRQLYKQQLGRIGYEASHERRFFELGSERGMKRLLELKDEAHVTRELIEACDLQEATLALQLFARDGGLESQQADTKAESTETDAGEGQQSASSALPDPEGVAQDPIQEILSSLGVDYTHVNDELLGGSALEDAISAAAQVAMKPSNGGPSGSQSRRKRGRGRPRTAKGGGDDDDDDDGEDAAVSRRAHVNRKVTASGSSSSSAIWPPRRVRH